MQSDAWTRPLLLLIAVCLVVLVVQGFGPAADGDADSDGDSPGHYELTAIRGRSGTLLVLWDRQTGQVWRHRLGAPGAWVEVGVDLEEPAAPEEPAAVPEAPEEAAEPEPPA